MATIFYTNLNQITTTLGSGYSPSSGTLTLATGSGAVILAEIAANSLPAISPTNPVRVSVVVLAHKNDAPIPPAFRTIFRATGLVGDVLSGIAAIEGTTDRAYAAGDAVRFNATAGAVNDLGTAVNAAEVSLAGKQAAGSYLTALTGDVSASGPGSAAAILATVAIPGTATKVTYNTKGLVTSGTTLTAGDIPAIAESGVTGLVADLASKAPALVPTAVKTSAYTAVAGDLVPVDTTSGAVPITLPTAPADGSRVAVKLVIQGGTNAVTIACGGSDVFNKAGGPTTGTLSLLNQAIGLQYRASGAIWYVVADDLPLSQLDLRYATPSPFVASGASHAKGLVPDPGAAAGTTRFLREDATFAAPPAATPGGGSGSIQTNNGSGGFGGTTFAALSATGGLTLVNSTTSASVEPWLNVESQASATGLVARIKRTGETSLDFKFLGTDTAYIVASNKLALCFGGATANLLANATTGKLMLLPVDVGELTSAPVGVSLGRDKSLIFTSWTSTTEGRPTAILIPSLVVTTDATYTARLTVNAVDYAGTREGFRVESTGTGVLTSVNGVAAVARAAAIATPTDLATCITAVTAIRDAIKNFGITL